MRQHKVGLRGEGSPPPRLRLTPNLHVMFVHVVERFGGKEIKNHILCSLCRFL
jgi:hypothetical protein